MNTGRLHAHAYAYGVSLLLVALVTLVVALVREAADVANASIIYLLAVLAAAVLFGSRPAIVAAIASFLAYNFFFIEPHYHLNVTDDDQWIALALLLLSGLITGQLASSLRQRAAEAERREREAIVLYDVVRLMAEPELQRALTGVAERLRAELRLSSVLISFGSDGAIRAQADSGDPESLRITRDALGLSGALLSRGSTPTADNRGETGRWVKVVPPTRRDAPGLDRARRVPISSGGTEIGAVVLVSAPGAPPFSREEDRLLSVVADQLGVAFERLRLQREASDAEVLRRTDELRTALVNAVSHDLRTPLSSIIASAGSLLQDDINWAEDERKEFLQAIDQEAGRLNRLVGNLLDMSRIEAGSLKPEKGWYDLGSLVEETVGRLSFLAASHGLVVDVPDSLPPVEFDYVEMDQVLTNLVENALKYTPPGSTITVSVRHSGHEVQVEVSDDGPGIPPDAVPRLFDPFYRAPSSVSTPVGSGLGLAVARGLVEAHGGRIWAENRSTGGASFIFTLPVSNPSTSVAGISA